MQNRHLICKVKKHRCRCHNYRKTDISYLTIPREICTRTPL